MTMARLRSAHPYVLEQLPKGASTACRPARRLLANAIALCSLRDQVMAGKRKPNDKSWVRKVKTVSTYPPEGLFTKDAKTIARVMATTKVSPGGIGSGIRMIQYFINRGGKGLSSTRKRELEKAKRLLQEKARAKK